MQNGAVDAHSGTRLHGVTPFHKVPWPHSGSPRPQETQDYLTGNRKLDYKPMVNIQLVLTYPILRMHHCVQKGINRVVYMH